MSTTPGANLIPPNGTILYRITRFLLRVIFTVYNRWQVEGREHIPATGGVLLFANHTSYADPPIAGPACLRPVNFMAKSELFKVPLLGPFIRRAQAFPVRRGEADQEALRRALRVLKAEQVLLIFPEGARSLDGHLQPFEAGAAFVALASNAAVIPMAIDGADKILPRKIPLLLPVKLRVRFGPPVDLSAYRAQRRTKETLQQASDEMHTALKNLLPEHRRPVVS